VVDSSAVVLYGPPASGKDTITTALSRLDERYVLLRKLKLGSGRTVGYRPITVDALARLRIAGSIIYENRRYGNSYAIDRAELERIVAAGGIPVVHIGQIAGVRAVVAEPMRWIAVRLTCPLSVAADRLKHRGDADVSARLIAWHETAADFAANLDVTFDRVIDTSRSSALQVARLIDFALRGD
jgi:guanylate kinase